MSEPFELSRWKPAPFLPERDGRDASLVFVVAVLCFLACLTAMGVIAADRAARGWTALRARKSSPAWRTSNALRKKATNGTFDFPLHTNRKRTRPARAPCAHQRGAQ